MSLEPITEDEIEFFESWYTPKALIETLFHNWDNLSVFDEKKFGELRLYQQSMLSDESIIDFELTGEQLSLSRKQIFQLRKNVGDLYNYGARKYGKSMITMIMDMLDDMMTSSGVKAALASVDMIHIKQILDPVKSCLENHPICKLFKRRIISSPDYQFELKNGYLLNSVNFNIGCFDDKTEILTEAGFKTVYNITKSDKVLSLNSKTNKSDYFPIERIIKYNYEGNIYHLKGKCLDFYFTPEHRLYYNWSLKQDWQIAPISDLKVGSAAPVLFSHTIDLVDCNDKDLNLNRELKFSTISDDDWLEFLGWFISEGSLQSDNKGSYKVVITQFKSVHPIEHKKICDLLTRMGLKFWVVSGKQIVFSSKEIYEHLKEHCYTIESDARIRTKSVYCCYNKSFPKYVKNLSKRQTKMLLDSFWLGDGSEDKGLKRWMTSSTFLANDLHEAVLKIGIPSSLRIKQKDRTPLYTVGELKSKTRRLSFKNGMTVEPWNNLVWCVETNPHGLIFIRRNGCCMWTGNSKNPGQQFYGKHYYKLYIEEASLENDEVYDKRKDAISELGAIYRVSGMTNFTPQSPSGKAFYGPETHKFVLNYPQFVSPFWDENEKNQRLEQYGGEGTIGYRMFVKGEVVEDCITTFDMARVRAASIFENKEIKLIEIPKDRFPHFKTFLVVERPVNAERIFVAADIGLHVTEINVFSEVGNKYEYLYNITLNNLIDDEQATIFKYLAAKLQANVIALDCGDGMGRAIYNELEKTIPVDNLVWYDGSMKIPVGFEVDKNNKTIMEVVKDSKTGVLKTVPVYKYEIMAEWSVKNLRDLLYNGRMIIPEDYKFLAQFGQVVGMTSGNRIIYKCTSSQGDHLFDSFRVLSIAIWNKKDFSSTPKIQMEWGCGATN